MTKKVVALLLALLLCIGLSGCMPMSREGYLVGEWKGQLNMAQVIYDELLYELDMDFRMQVKPVYADIYLEFDRDGGCRLLLDRQSFSSAIAESVAPFVDMFFDFDTEWLINMMFQYAMGESGIEENEGWYTLDADNRTVIIYLKDETLFLDFQGRNLKLEAEDIDQTIIFSKQRSGGSSGWY